MAAALVVSISTAIAGGRSGDRNLMDDYLQSKTSVNSGASSAFSQQSTLIVFESTLSVFSKLFRSCALELFVVALLVLRMFVSVLASENFLSKSSLSTRLLFQGWLTTCHQLQYSTVLTSVPAVVNIVVSTELFTIKIMAVDSFLSFRLNTPILKSRRAKQAGF
jgi:hypothetical protein